MTTEREPASTLLRYPAEEIFNVFQPLRLGYDEGGTRRLLGPGFSVEVEYLEPEQIKSLIVQSCVLTASLLGELAGDRSAAAIREAIVELLHGPCGLPEASDLFCAEFDKCHIELSFQRTKENLG